MQTILDNLQPIITIISLLITAGIFTGFRKFYKEIKELIATYKSAKEDGFTDAEKEEILKELDDVISEGMNLYKLIRKTFKKK